LALSWLQAISIVLPIMAAAVDFVAAVIVLVAARDRVAGRVFAAMALCIGFWSVGVGLRAIPGAPTSVVHLYDPLVFALIFLPALGVHNAGVWTGAPTRLVRALSFAAYSMSAFFAIGHARGMFIDGHLQYPWGTFGRPGVLYPGFVAYTVVCVVIAYGLGSAGTKRSDAAVRLRAKYWLWGLRVFAPLGCGNFLVNYGVHMLPTGSLGNILLVALLAYAAVRHRLMDIDVFLMRAAATFVASVIIVLPAAGVWIWLQNLPFGLSGAVVVGSLLLAAGLNLAMFSKLRAYFERSIESSLFPARRQAREEIRKFSDDLVKLSSRENLGPRLVALLVDGLRVRGAALYLAHSDRQGFRLACTHGSLPTPESVEELPAAGDGECDRRSAPRTQDWELCVPIYADGDTLGFIALGAKASGGAISDTDLTLLTVLAAQLAVALQNGRCVDRIEQQKMEIEELHKRLKAENVALRAEVRSTTQFKEIIGSSAALQRALAVAEKVAGTDVSVLITGETGTGKELVARAIHDLSPRREGPLISVNCAAIPADLAESELFGHERGAFTSAVDAHPGKFELADGGTIFLDEIADLPAKVQVKLLRVLQEREVCRVGGHKVRKLDIRIIAATNRDLHAQMRAGQFREDLYYRLAGIPVHVPALRRRLSDIPMLASFFLDRAVNNHQKSIEGISPEAMRLLGCYSWPGNIRELQNVIERAVLLCSGDTIRPEHLGDLALHADGPMSLSAIMQVEKAQLVLDALHQTGNNQAAAARLLGMSRSNLARLIKSLGLDVPRRVQ
jgi:transcriptional regulator with GAF, ATPase, and Fis domain